MNTNWKGLFLVLTISTSCGDGDDNLIDGFTPQEWDEIEKLSPLGDPPPDPTNRVADDPTAATLGQMLFFEKRLSGPIFYAATQPEGALGAVGEVNKYNCADCHDPNSNFVDVRSNPPETSLGAGAWLTRNGFTLVNAVYYEWSGWPGFIDTYWGHSYLALDFPFAGNGDALRTAHVAFDHYRTEYNAVFDPDLDPALDPLHAEAARFPASARPKAMPTDPDGAWEMMTMADQGHALLAEVNVAKTMAAYIRKLIRKDAPFDRYVAGDTAAISAGAKRGLKLFIGKAACVECHSGPFFSDQKFHNVGVPSEGAHTDPMEMGRTLGVMFITSFMKPFSSAGMFSDHTIGSKVEGLVGAPEDLGSHRTQGLRNVEGTAPYMHTGRFTDLRSVVELYNEGGKETGYMGVRDELIKPLNLTETEIDDLVEFLEALTCDPLSEALKQNTAKP